MAKVLVRRWLSSLISRPQTIRNKKPERSRLRVNRLEERDVPSVNIPIQGVSWTEVGPRSVLNGESPGRTLTATGRTTWLRPCQ